MSTDIRAITISQDADALDALSRMQRAGMSRLLIAEDDHLLGMITSKDLLKFLNLKLELEGERDSSPVDDASLAESETDEEALVHH